MMLIYTYLMILVMSIGAFLFALYLGRDDKKEEKTRV
jgi:hypothetical protein